jgi:hypothetical protein
MGKIDNRIRRLFVVFLVLLLSPVITFAREAREQQRIDYLFASLASLKGAVFIRNGKEYDAQAARDHLQSKLNYFGPRLKTAEDFVKYCASESSMSHKPYQIRFADGAVTDTAPYFLSKLREFDQKNH